jgi:hypothetical protein
MARFLEFTIGAATSLVKDYIPTDANYFVTTPSNATVVLTAVGGVATADVITITFTTADATYASHAAVINALAQDKDFKAVPCPAIIVVDLPLVGATQQLITSIAIA